MIGLEMMRLARKGFPLDIDLPSIHRLEDMW